MTLVSAVMVTMHDPVPEQPPPPVQPVNVDPPVGKALSVTTVFGAYAFEQVAPQEMPAGLLSTAPVLVPVLVTLSVKVTGVGVRVIVAVRVAVGVLVVVG